MFISKLQLEYLSNQDWQAWPAWAVSMFELGCHIANLNEKGHRVVVGLILPTRAYASPLLTAGIVIQRALRMDTAEWHRKRFEDLWNLPEGMGCYVFVNKTRFRGIIGAKEENQNGRCRRIKYNNRKGTILIFAHQAHWVQPIERTFKLKGDQSGTTFESPNFFGEVLAYLERPVRQWSSSLECILVGNVGVVEEELELPIRVGQSHCGRLGDLLLPKRIEGDGLIYRSDLISPFADLDEPLLMPETVLVMDGSAAFLEAAENWPRHDLVVLLDPHDKNFAEAVEKLNSWWRSSVADLDPNVLTEIPAGVEVTAFKQRGGDD